MGNFTEDVDPHKLLAARCRHCRLTVNYHEKSEQAIEGMQWPMLQHTAKRVLSLLTSSAASERSFSTMGFIHTKLRNRLTHSMVEKLVFVRSNHLLAQKGLEDSSSDEEDDIDSSDPEDI